MELFIGRPELNAKDVSAIVSTSIDKLKTLLNDELYLTASGTGVVTAAAAIKDIESKLLAKGM
jgi:hypothetical protein